MSWTERYKTDISDFFSSKGRFDEQARVELVWLEALRDECGLFDDDTDIDTRGLSLEKVKNLEEKETKHDIAALIHVLEESTNIRYVHFGLTSQDINDTSMSLQLKKARSMIVNDSLLLCEELKKLSKDKTVCIARTHGQHAIPITIGWKFKNFLQDTVHLVKTMNSAKFIGKLHGSVGTGAALESVGIDSKKLADKVMSRLELRTLNYYTQTTSRIYLVEFMQSVVNTACQVEKIAKEIRNLQRSEIKEVYEDYSSGQVGSSAMPQKRNPVVCEQICGIARVIRAQLGPLMETIALEHERDLTNSSVERIEIPIIMTLTHYIILKMTSVLSTIKINKKKCKENSELLKGRQFSEKVMTHLIRYKGLTRKEAHKFLNRGEEGSFFTQLKLYFTEKEILNLIDPVKYLGIITKEKN